MGIVITIEGRKVNTSILISEDVHTFAKKNNISMSGTLEKALRDMMEKERTENARPKAK